jgi:hypothetical protein
MSLLRDPHAAAQLLAAWDTADTLRALERASYVTSSAPPACYIAPSASAAASEECPRPNGPSHGTSLAAAAAPGAGFATFFSLPQQMRQAGGAGVSLVAAFAAVATSDALAALTARGSGSDLLAAGAAGATLPPLRDLTHVATPGTVGAAGAGLTEAQQAPTRRVSQRTAAALVSDPSCAYPVLLHPLLVRAGKAEVRVAGAPGAADAATPLPAASI